MTNSCNMTDLPSSILACPICQDVLLPNPEIPTEFRCKQSHCFDQARQGYLNLLVAQHKRSKKPGDSAEMVRARKAFLEAGYYEAISDFVCQHTHQTLSENKLPPEHSGVHIADVGCGEGYYSHRLSQYLSGELNLAKATDDKQVNGLPAVKHRLYAVDISREAIKAACRRTGKHSNPISWLVASGGRLPLQDGKLDMILSLFTPVMPEGWRKALKPGGCLLLLVPAEHHLVELRQLLYSSVKSGSYDPSQTLKNAGFSLISTYSLEKEIQVGQDDLPNLLKMTPHGWRTTSEGKENVTSQTVLNTRLHVKLLKYRLEN